MKVNLSNGVSSEVIKAGGDDYLLQEEKVMFDPDVTITAVDAYYNSPSATGVRYINYRDDEGNRIALYNP